MFNDYVNYSKRSDSGQAPDCSGGEFHRKERKGISHFPLRSLLCDAVICGGLI
jgi:hypothetical protein